MSAREMTFGSPSGGAEHHNHQTYDSRNVRKILDTTRPTPSPVEGVVLLGVRQGVVTSKTTLTRTMMVKFSK